MKKMTKMSLCIGVILLWTVPVYAAELMIFPAKGQSDAQMEKDKSSCYSWAKKNTGVDPLALAQKSAEQPPPSGPQGERVRGAARGAAGGAVIGAVAGDAGKGAAIGATAGVIAGGAKQRQNAKAQQSAQQQQQAQTQQSLDTYNRAYAACLEGKGYTVK
jgi:hypothetical protein